MTTELGKVLQSNFPAGFDISEEHGTLLIRDAATGRGRGYLLTVAEEFNDIQAKLEFESFAGQLAAYTAGQLQKQKELIRELLKKYTQLNIKVVRQSIEDILLPDQKNEDIWWLVLNCRQNADRQAGHLLFADILLSLVFALLPYSMEGEPEGGSAEELSKYYERSRVNRALCLAYHGYNCKACGLNMRQLYSGLASDFIHVHHLNPVAAAGVTKPDPIKDMAPLCPNCHGVAHQRNPPYTVAEIKSMIQPTV
jgi:predicted HNH restriction endonuclease